ncbi:hypothetical protein [Peribacillus acanthi]|uniref:hypothetical protein n=1 Tax=Peribacillus acanthi TaxID=2171554 RepID=UPI001F0BF448|nr:hypothetical protein [Peribacillus acanthi]
MVYRYMLFNGIENGIPWWDDLFLDIVLLPTGEVIEKMRRNLRMLYQRELLI